MKYLLKLSYLGTNYCGFQVQPDKPTIQGTLCKAAGDIFKGKCLVTGCSRTDSGVHANEYYATLESTNGTVIPEERLPYALNTALPEDISILSAEKKDDDYRIREHIAGKEYMYKIWNSKIKNPFISDRSWRYPQTLDVSRMNEGAKHIIGTHDFTSFMAAGSDITDCVRTVTDCRVQRDGDTVTVYVSADGFLYNMVRIITGTLIEIPPEDIKSVIESKRRDSAGLTVPACGLYLNRVFLK